MDARIRLSADIHNHYDEISRQCRKERVLVIFKENSRGDIAVLGLQDYYQMESELELFHMLVTAEEDVKAERVEPVQETFDDIRSRLLETKNGIEKNRTTM